jgi:hypothetical protein
MGGGRMYYHHVLHVNEPKMILKRRVRAAHGREARPNLTSFTFMVLGVFQLMQAGGGCGDVEEGA